MQTVLCIKWGTRYPVDYVNPLWAMVQRHTSRQTRLVCFTDDATGINPAVTTFPLLKIDIPERVAWKPWRKVSLWQAPLEDFSGDVLYLDLDTIVTGNIDDFFDFNPGRFCAAENWTQIGQKICNTSCYRFHVGDHTNIFEDFNRDAESVLEKYRIEQQYISREISEMTFWPEDWCLSFKHALFRAGR